MFDFHRTLQFTALLERFQKVERMAYVPESDRKENDAEHSYKLAMIAWYLIEREKLPLDSALVLRYALVHDLVEAYAGDTVVWDREAEKTKHDREDRARRRIEEEFPEFPSLHAFIVRYEAKADEEARFVYTLDKIFYFFPEYLAKWRTIRELNISFADEYIEKDTKTKAHPLVNEWTRDILAEIEKQKERLWGTS